MSTYTLLLDFGTGYEDYSSCLMADGFRLTECVGAEGKHQTQSCSLQLRGEELTGKLYAATSFVKAILKKDSVVVFTGVIRPYISYTAEHIDIGKVSVEILDYSELLEKYVYVSNEFVDKGVMEAEYENYSIFNPSSPSTSIVHTLAGLCGINALSGEAVTKTISLFRLPGDSYVKDALEDLLYQHQLDYRFLPDGTMHILSTDISPTPAVTVTDFKNSFTHEKTDSSAEGCLVTYRVRKENVELANTPIAKFKSEKFSTGSILYVPIPDEVAPGLNGADIQITPEKALLDSTVIPPNCDLEWWDLTNIRVTSKKEDKGSFSTINTINSWDDEKVNLTVKWKGTIWMWQANYVVGEIYGTFDYIYKASTRAGITGDSPLSYDAEYIYSLSEAQTLADALARKLAVNRYTYTFSSFENLEVGSLATLQEEDLLGLSAKVRILSRTYSDDTGLYSYTAEGAGDSTLNPPVPEIVPIEVIPVPQGDPLTATVSHEIIYSNDDLTFIGATVTGYVPDFYGVTEFTWSVNDSVIAATSSTVDIPTSLLTANLNSIKCTAVYNGVTYEDIASVRVVSSVRGISISTDGFSYTFNGKGELSPADQLIHATVVRTGVEGTPSWEINGAAISTTADTIEVPASYLTGYQIIVRCTVGEYSASTYIYKNSDGSTTYYQWCLSASSTVFTEANKLRLYEYDSSFMLWDTYPLSNSSLWQRTKPQPTTELPYVWERVSEDSGSTWSEPYCISTNPFSSITLEASQLAYKILANGYVQEAQSIVVSCRKMFTNEPCYWIVKKGTETTKLSNVNTISIDIPVGATYRFVDVTCICDGKSRSLRIIGEAEALPTYQKLSTININDLASTTTRDDGSPLVVGDYRLVLSGEYHLPYVWNGTSWKGSSPTDSNYGLVVSSLAPDVWASDQTIPSVSAIYGFYKSLFSSSLLANTLTVGSNQFLEQLAQNQGLLESIGSDAIVGTQLASNSSLINNESFKQAMAQNPLIASALLENPSFIESIVTTAIVVATTNFSCAFGSVEGVPTFDIAYGGNTIFRIVPSTGRVFIGKPNSSLDGAETGFMYEPATGQITSKSNKVVINSNGEITATDGSFSGTIDATSGVFNNVDIINSEISGNIDTVSFSAMPSEAGTQKINIVECGTTAASQAEALISNLGDRNATIVYYAEHDSSITYVSIYHTGGTVSGYYGYTFYDKNMNSIGLVSRSYSSSAGYYTYTSSFVGTDLVLYQKSGSDQVFKFKDIPIGSDGLEEGQVYRDIDGFVKVVFMENV